MRCVQCRVYISTEGLHSAAHVPERPGGFMKKSRGDDLDIYDISRSLPFRRLSSLVLGFFFSTLFSRFGKDATLPCNIFRRRSNRPVIRRIHTIYGGNKNGSGEIAAVFFRSHLSSSGSLSLSWRLSYPSGEFRRFCIPRNEVMTSVPRCSPSPFQSW